jgi:GH15 family glucan-1,4-alpha-glucosidase
MCQAAWVSLSELGLIGNCQLAALVRNDGAVAWCCLPRFDSEPVFGALLDEAEGGAFVIRGADDSRGVQRYIPNTNVLETRFQSAGGAFRVLDFAPRFVLHERSFRPTKIVRIVEPLTGTPRIRVSCNPVLGWSKRRPVRDVGSHHVSFLGYDAELRLTTDAPLAYLDGEPFALTEKQHFVLAWGAPVEEPLEPLCDRFLRETVRYWQRWVKHCQVPSLYQDAVIRSALSLKLHCYEDTGAIIASPTTSIPEAPGSGRTWDYRYCWLRDAFYVLGAFRLLGHFEEREQFLNFLLNVAAGSDDLELAPLYRVDGKTNLAERIESHWAGYLGDGPVRVGNAAASHRQHDVFGEMVLALTPLFLDARFREHATSPVLELVTRLARKAVRVAGTPDTGIWEHRSEARPRTFSALMCWAAADRMSRIAAQYRPDAADEFERAAADIRVQILAQGVDKDRGCLVADYGGKDLDAALLQAVTLHFLPRADARAHRTVDAIRTELMHHGWLKRYVADDGLGQTSVAFTLCTFWLVEALAGLGHREEARQLLGQLINIDAPLGLLSEDVDPSSGRMWGNFPQAYSHVGLIHGAFAASPRWAAIGS